MPATDANERKKKVRGGHRAHLTKMLGEVEETLMGYTADQEARFLTLKGCLERKASIISKLDEEILEEIEEDAIDGEIEQTELIQDQIREFIIKIEKVLGKGTVKREEPRMSSTSSTGKNVKLPKYEIEKFHGDAKKYRTFRDSFEVAIMKHEALADVEKFTYLRSFLAGEAKRAVEGLAVTNDNFAEALEILDNRFGNYQVIVNSHVEELIRMSGVTNKDNTKGLRELYDNVEMHLRSLRTLKVDPDKYGFLLVPVMKTKLPDEINLLLSRKFDSNVDLWQIEDMMKELRIEVEARERCATSVTKSREPKLPLTTEGLLTQARPLTCPYCEGRHFPDKCRSVTNPEARKRILIEKKRCFLCTKGQHLANGCDVKRNCYICSGKHHTSICTGEKSHRRNTSREETNTNRNEEQNLMADAKSRCKSTTTSTGGSILLQTARVQVMNPTTEKRGSCRLILDTGSQRTYITRRMQKDLDLAAAGTEYMSIGAFGGGKTRAKQHDIVEIAVKGGRSDTLYMKAVVVENICSPLQGQKINVAKNCYEHLKGLQLADEEDGRAIDVEVLVGLDNYWRVVTGEIVRGVNGPVAIQTKFGYILSGPSNTSCMVANEPSIEKITSTLFVGTSSEHLRHELQCFWNLESIGILNEPTLAKRKQENIKFVNNRYEVELPWRETRGTLGDNYALAKRRLRSLIRRLKRDPEILRSYANIMDQQLEEGILERVTNAMTPVAGKTYYMPHQPVIRKDKQTTKIRIVYDVSSAEKENVSLNECLEVPDAYFTDLFAVLVRFGCNKIALVADIEKAFLMIGMDEKDRNALRLLWVEDPFANELTEIMLRFTRVTFGVAPSMWHLGATINHHLTKYVSSIPETVQKIEESLYADDFSGGENEFHKAVKLYRDAKQVFKEAGMNLRKWRSNSSDVMNVIIREEAEHEETQSESVAKMMLNPEDASPVKVLGIPWDVKSDKLAFSLESAIAKMKPEKMTKRELLRGSASVYDPRGGLAPIVVLLKMLFQRICKDDGSWDDELKGEVKEIWSKWITSAERCNRFEIPRCYDSTRAYDSRIMLIGFCDASEAAYAAVVYIRISPAENDSKATTSFVAAKTRVAPLVKQSIPRLELLGALILSRLMQRIMAILQNSMRIEIQYCMTDSAVVLHWIQNVGKSYKQYVQNRVIEIRRLTPPAIWRHIPGAENIADLPSRGCLPEQLQRQQERWFHGPGWLSQEIPKWPIRMANEVEMSDELKEKMSNEMKKNTEREEITCLIKDDRSIEDVIDPIRYSTFTKLIRVTAWCLRFLEKCKGNKDVEEDITTEELDRAKIIWLRNLQSQVKREQKYEKMVESLGVQEDKEGYLRCMGRLGRGKLPFNTKHPLLLPAFHWVTTLMIRYCHETVYHNGVRETLAEFRSNYWIAKGRQRVKAILKKCRLCRLMEGLHYPAPTTADLPDFRVAGGRVFRTTGVDFCGPVYVKSMYQTRHEKMNKAYVVLLTCATSRMVHLELCPDLTTESYIRSQQRFMGRRGIPSLMVSDNGRTFKGSKLRRFNAERGIRWRFNLARAPWWGGMFEVMIRAAKRCLRKAIGSKRLTYEELTTVLTEIETVLNCRPITYIYEDDVEVPLTPSQLFCGRRLLDREDISTAATEDDVVVYRAELLKRVKNEEEVVDHFWKRWYREYLVDLREHHKLHKGREGPNMVEGDVVIVEEEGTKRNKWKLGKIEQVVRGDDDVIRGAVVLTSKKGVKGRVSRPLQKLYPLEITEKLKMSRVGSEEAIPSLSHSSMSENPMNTTNEELDSDKGKLSSIPYGSSYGPNRRSRRNAGIVGEAKRREIELQRAFNGGGCSEK